MSQNMESVYFRCEEKGGVASLKHIVELYQKYRPKSEVHLIDKATPYKENNLCI